MLKALEEKVPNQSTEYNVVDGLWGDTFLEEVDKPLNKTMFNYQEWTFHQNAASGHAA